MALVLPANPTLSIPLDFSGKAPPDGAGLDPAGVQAIEAVFAGQLEAGLHPGAQLLVLRAGRVIVDLATGLADVHRRIPVTPDTPFLVWSLTKPLTAMCVHKLAEEGQVDLDAPIAAYWPEFGCRGKEQATLRQTLLHQAGLPLNGLYHQALHWFDWDSATRRLAGCRPEHPPGRQTAYHVLNYGFILGEIVRRVSGLPIADYLRQDFLAPLGMRRTWLSLPPGRWNGTARLYSGCPDQHLPVFFFNLPNVRRAILPAGSLHSTARDLAVFYQMLLNGGEYAGRRYLQPETVAAATSLGYSGYDATLRHHVHWGHGFMLGGAHRVDPAAGAGMGAGSTERTFGHYGQRTSMAWADPEAGLVVVFICNRHLDRTASQSRWQAISESVWQALGPGA